MAQSSPWLLSIGNVEFTVLEAPSRLAFPSTQAMAVNVNVGGKKIIQTLGHSFGTISWQGLFETENADSRSRLLERMHAEGSPQKLLWGSRSFIVVVRDYSPEYEHSFKINYSISVEPSREVGGATTIATPSSIDSKITSSTQAANTHLNATLSGDPSSATVALQPSYTSMTSALESAGPAAAARGITAANASTAISTAIANASKYVQQLPPNASTQLILSANRYLGELQVIQRNFNRGQAPKTISVSGGTLYDVASKEYGDPALAHDLRKANGLTSLNLPSGQLFNLVIPPLR